MFFLLLFKSNWVLIQQLSAYHLWQMMNRLGHTSVVKKGLTVCTKIFVTILSIHSILNKLFLSIITKVYYYTSIIPKFSDEGIFYLSTFFERKKKTCQLSVIITSYTIHKVFITYSFIKVKALSLAIICSWSHTNVECCGHCWT